MPADTSVYRHKRSPHWIVSYLDPATLRRKHVTTPFRLDDPTGHRRALAFAAEKSREASKLKGHARTEAWEAWAPAYITDRYGARPKTLQRYEGCWSVVREFLAEEKVHLPAALHHNHLVRYVAWRTAQKRNAGKPIARNTALVELKVLRLVMQEAVRRGFAQGNPCLRHGIQRLPPRQKPEMTDQEIAQIRRLLIEEEGHLALEARWMTVCFEIAIHQGCRLTETSLPLDHIDTERNTIRFEAKGRDGVKHVFTTALHPGLRPLVLALREAGATHTCRLPKVASVHWWKFFRAHGLGHLCFHCTRVTVVTRLARSQVPKSQAMRFVGHSSEMVHAIYQRLEAPDLGAAVAALSGLAAPSAPPISGSGGKG
jgi:hypothetical protein